MMRTVLASSDIFEASTKLQAAATALEKLGRHEELHDDEHGNLKWCGVFLQEVDWSTEAAACGEGASHMSVRATEVRPLFFATLRNTQRLFHDAGMQRPEEVREFLCATYHFLQTADEPREEQQIPNVTVAAAFLHRLSEELLSRLSGNGIPADRERPISIRA